MLTAGPSNGSRALGYQKKEKKVDYSNENNEKKSDNPLVCEHSPCNSIPLFICHRISEMPKRKTELQIKIVKVLDVRECKCGQSFKIKVAYHNPTWVSEEKLSTGVADTYLNELPLPKGVCALMSRRYKDKHKRKNPLLSMLQQTPDPDGTDEDGDTPVKKKKKKTKTKCTNRSCVGLQEFDQHLKRFHVWDSTHVEVV